MAPLSKVLRKLRREHLRQRVLQEKRMDSQELLTFCRGRIEVIEFQGGQTLMMGFGKPQMVEEWQ